MAVLENIVVGRDQEDLEKFGEKGTAFIGMHIVGDGEDAKLTNAVLMDVTKPHVVLAVGKRGTGKSYSAAVIAEEMALLPKEIRENLSVLMIDTMGIFWSMKSPNEKGRSLLKDWKRPGEKKVLEPLGMDAKLFVPKAYTKTYKDSGVEVDYSLTLACGDLSSDDWIITFGFSSIDSHGIAIERAIKQTKLKYGTKYDLSDIIKTIDLDKRTEPLVKEALINMFEAAQEWGIFEKEGTPISSLFQSGTVSVIDVSHYMRVSGGWNVRSLLVGLLSRRIFMERLIARKSEEFQTMSGEEKKKVPMVWLMNVYHMTPR